MSPLLEPYKKPRPCRLPPYFYLLLSMALLAIPRPYMQLPSSLRATATKLHVLPTDVVHGQSVESVTLPHNASPSTLNTTHADPHPSPRECGHIVLVSAARHGSTWLIDSVEGCHSVNGSYGRVNRVTELWNAGQRGPLRSMPPGEAAEYARWNHSIKVFPPALNSHGKAGLRALFEAVKRNGAPVFVLRRRLEDSYDSLEVAKETRLWNSEKVVVEDAGERAIVKDGKWTAYFRRMEEYFGDVESVLKGVDVVWDEIRYEDVISQTRIVGRKNGCYIRNCNFRR